MQHEDFADAVVTLVKNALAPVQERLASAEARLAMLGDVRDRVIAIETKPNEPVVIQPPLHVLMPSDLTPVLERVSATEAVLKTIGDLRDRVVVMETKSAQPVPPVDVGDIREKLTGLQSELESMREFGWSMTKANPLLEKFEALGTELNALRERLAVAETRQFIPGPMGRDGQPGRDGKDGKDGVDGLGYDELGIEQEPDIRTVKFMAKRGLHTKEFGRMTIPVEIYRGVYVEGKTYDKGDGVTWGGSEWHCNDTTATKPGDGSKAWTLKVKRGRDGRDAQSGSTTPLPVVKR